LTLASIEDLAIVTDVTLSTKRVAEIYQQFVRQPFRAVVRNCIGRQLDVDPAIDVA